MLESLKYGKTFAGSPFLYDSLPAVIYYFVNFEIGTVLVMVKKPEPFHMRPERKAEGIVVHSVSPGFCFRVILSGEFGVMDEKISVSGKVNVSINIKAAGVGIGEFVVCEEDKDLAVFSEPIPETIVRMAQLYRCHVDGVDSEGGAAYSLMVDIGSDFPVVYGKIGRLHCFPDHVFQGFLCKRAAEYPYMGLCVINGFEKGKPEKVVPVCVGEDHGVFISFLFDQAVAELSDT